MDLTPLFKNTDHNETFPARTTIFEQGMPGHVMYIIAEGEVDIYSSGKLIDTFGAGELFGEMALIDSSERHATAIAKTSCILVPVDEKKFLYMTRETPYFSLHVMRVLTERLRKREARQQAAT